MKRILGNNRDDRGFTLLEIMISFALSVVVMGFLFGVSFQSQRALRGFAQLGEHTDGITAARELISTALRQAGSSLPTQGLRISTLAASSIGLARFTECQADRPPAPAAPTGLCSPTPTHRIIQSVNVRNGVPGAPRLQDQILVLRGEGESVIAYPTTDMTKPFVVPSATAAARLASAQILAVVDPDGTTGCLIKPDLEVGASGLTLVAPPAGYNAGLAKAIPLLAGAPENQATHIQFCPWNRSTVNVVPVVAEWIYIIDDGNRYLAQTTNWDHIKAGTQSSAIGVDFTNLQFSLRFVEEGDAEDADGDGDPRRDWYGNNQGTILNVPLSPARNIVQTAARRPVHGIPIAVGVTVERRSAPYNDLRTTKSPTLARKGSATGPGRNYNNSHGDFESLDLTTTTQTSYISEIGVGSSSYLDPDGNGSNDGLPYLYSSSFAVIALRNAGGAL